MPASVQPLHPAYEHFCAKQMHKPMLFEKSYQFPDTSPTSVHLLASGSWTTVIIHMHPESASCPMQRPLGFPRHTHPHAGLPRLCTTSTLNPFQFTSRGVQGRTQPRHMLKQADALVMHLDNPQQPVFCSAATTSNDGCIACQPSHVSEAHIIPAKRTFVG